MKIKQMATIEIIAVITVLLNSGGNFILRNIYVFFGICLLLLIKKKRLTQHNVLVLIVTIIYVVFNSCLMNSAPTDSKELLLFLVRVTGSCIIVTNISDSRFYTVFIKVMVAICIFSLLWFALLFIGVYPPFLKNINGIYVSCFHTVGFSLQARRNSGIFSEPGLFQIYINIAILLLSKEKGISNHKKKKILLLFLVTLLSTGSAMGYLCLVLSMVIWFYNDPNFFKGIGNKTQRRVMLGLLLVGVCVLEVNYGVIRNFIFSWNSYASRHDDTLVSILIARDHPLFGIGIATDKTNIWNSYLGKLGQFQLYKSSLTDLAGSNGLGNCIYTAGVPFSLVYMVSIVKTYKNRLMVKEKKIEILLVIEFILFFFGEPYMITPFFLMSLFKRYGDSRERA